jgi:hypothetical protein
MGIGAEINKVMLTPEATIVHIFQEMGMDVKLLEVGRRCVIAPELLLALAAVNAVIIAPHFPVVGVQNEIGAIPSNPFIGSAIPTSESGGFSERGHYSRQTKQFERFI